MTELCQGLGEVPLVAYQAAKERLEAAEERQRWLYRLHRLAGQNSGGYVGGVP